MGLFCESCRELAEERVRFQGSILDGFGNVVEVVLWCCEPCLFALSDRNEEIQANLATENQLALRGDAENVTKNFESYAEEKTAEIKNALTWGLFPEPLEPTGDKVTAMGVDRAVEELISDDPEFKVLLKPKGGKHGRNKSQRKTD